MRILTTLLMVLVISAVSAQTARLQIIHNSPDPTVDIYVNDALFEGNFSFRSATAFADVPAGVNLKIDVAPAPSTSSSDAIFTDNVTLADGESYIAVASGIVGDATTPFTILYQDGMQEAATGSGVDFRGIHGSPDAPTVDIIARDVAILLDDVSYGDISGYINVPAGAYVLDVTLGNFNYGAVASFDADLSGLDGGSAVVFASGLLGGTPDFGLYAALADGTVVPFPARAAEFTNLQVIHNSPSPTVDVYVNGGLVVDDFTFRTATPFVPVPAGTRTLISIAPETSTSVADAIAEFEGTFRADREYVAVAQGIVGDATTPFGLAVQGNVRQSNPVGQVQFIAVHGSPDAPTVDVVADGALVLFDDLEYNNPSRYVGVPAASYTIDINTADGLSTVVSYTADLSSLAGGNAVVFASGFLAPAGSDPAFGLYAALADGTVIAFPTVAPRISRNDIEFTGITPTLASSTINLSFTSNTDETIGLMIMNTAGQLIMAESMNIDNGQVVSQLNISDLAPGIYFASFMTAEGPVSHRFVKQ